MNKQPTSLKQVSHHILPTSANLLGFTFIVLASIKSLGLSQSGMTDKLTALCVVLFAVSTLMSFLSVRGQETGHTTIFFEKIAQLLFLTAVLLCTLLAVLIAFDVSELGK